MLTRVHGAVRCRGCVNAWMKRRLEKVRLAIEEMGFADRSAQSAAAVDCAPILWRCAWRTRHS